MADEIPVGLFFKFGSPRENACVNQCGRRCVEVVGLKRLSQIFQRFVLKLNSLMRHLGYFVGKLSVVMGVLWSVLLERSKRVKESDEVILK